MQNIRIDIFFLIIQIFHVITTIIIIWLSFFLYRLVHQRLQNFFSLLLIYKFYVSLLILFEFICLRLVLIIGAIISVILVRWFRRISSLKIWVLVWRCVICLAH